MNRENVFERPSEKDTKKEISCRYENIKQALPQRKKRKKKKKKERISVHLNE